MQTFAYDEGDFSDSSLSQDISPTHHDPNYGSSYFYRGNVTSQTKCEAPSITCSGGLASQVKYNTAGSPVAQITPWNGSLTRTVRIGYSDSFNSTPGVSTYAYPTTITDPAGSSLGASGHSSSITYRYDIGANVAATSPAPAGQTYGKSSERIFDSVGRIEKESILVNGTAQSYVRSSRPSPDNGTQMFTHATVVDTNNNGPDVYDEVLSETLFDGAGRTLATRTELPGSTGGYSGTKIQYDILGRVTGQTLPTEIDSGWHPTGDDYRGTDVWLWTRQKYDWKGRVVRKINSDGADSPTLNDSDILISYDGCGCAGGQVTTIQSENVPIPGSTSHARRTQKQYEDILGRVYKTELYNWDGTSLYTTTEQTFNGRDQITNTKQTDKTDTGSPQKQQDVTMTYDGYGRMTTRHYPIEDTGTNTTWSYNPDGSIDHVTDPRGVVTAFTYNSRGLTTNIDYTRPTGSTIPLSSNVSLAYDNLGNRTSMTDGLGTVTYSYDPLSRLTSEARQFNDSLSNAPLEGSTPIYRINYSYQMSGGLKSITDPFGAVINYANDKLGRVSAVTGSGFGTVSTYASGMSYRAFGAPKEMTYGSTDGSVVSYSYGDTLKLTSSQATSSVISGGYIRKAAYSYLPDGRLDAVNNLIDSRFDESYSYDVAARLTESQSGSVTSSTFGSVPAYSQVINFNAFGDMTSRNANIWGLSRSFTANYTNGRKTGGNEVYDSAGNLVDKTTTSTVYDRWTFDASGAGNSQTTREYMGGLGSASYDHTDSITTHRDGDGMVVKRYENDTRVASSGSSTTEKTSYFVRSTVLSGHVLSEVNETGAKVSTKIYAGANEIVEQRGTSTVTWKHADAITGSLTTVDQAGNVFGDGDPEFNAEFEPLSGVIPQMDPVSDPDIAPLTYKNGGNIFRPENGCMVDFTPQPCDLFYSVIQTGGGSVGPPDQFRLVRDPRSGQVGWGQYHNYSNGMAGWWADLDGPNQGDVDSVHIPFNSDRNAALFDLNRGRARASTPGDPSDIFSIRAAIRSVKSPVSSGPDDPCETIISAMRDMVNGLRKRFKQQTLNIREEAVTHADQIQERKSQLQKQLDLYKRRDDCHDGDPETEKIAERAQEYLNKKIPIPGDLFNRGPIDSPIPIYIRVPESEPFLGVPAGTFSTPIFCIGCNIMFILNHNRFESGELG